MVKKILLTSVLLMGMVVCLSSSALSATLIVEPGTLGDNYFSTIQSAVNEAAAGDTILISPLAANQAYNEQVTVNKNDLKIMGWSGKGSPKSAKNKSINNQCTVNADNLSKWVSIADRWEDCCSPVILDGCDEESCMKTAITINAPNVTIEKLTIRHAYEGIRLEQDADNAVIENVCFFDCKEAINSNSTDGVLVSSCIFFGGDSYSIFLYGNNATVTGNRFRSVDDGIGIQGDNAVVDANIFLNCNDDSISLWFANEAIVRNNWIEGADDAVYIKGGDNVLVTNNRSKQADNGIFIESNQSDYYEPSTITNPVITNNWIEGAQEGIRVTPYQDINVNPTIRNNVVKYTTNEGILLNCDCTSGVIENNSISFALVDEEGMEIRGDVSNLIIQNNVIEYCSQDGLFYNGDNGIIRGNTVRFCGSESREREPGISIQGNNNLIEKNTVSKNSFDGILNWGGDNNTYSENILHQNGMSGICISYYIDGDNSENNSIINNIIESNHGEGINISAGALYTVIINNTLSGNKTDICNSGNENSIIDFSGNTYDTGCPDPGCNCVVR